jgi:hypothetical protein
MQNAFYRIFAKDLLEIGRIAKITLVGGSSFEKRPVTCREVIEDDRIKTYVL